MSAVQWECADAFHESFIQLAVAMGVIALGLVVWHYVFGADPTDKLSSTNPEERREGIAELAASAQSRRGIERIARAVKSENLSVACGVLRALAASSKPNKPPPAAGVKVAETASRDSRPPVAALPPSRFLRPPPRHCRKTRRSRRSC